MVENLVVQQRTHAHESFVAGQRIHLHVEACQRQSRIVVSVARSTESSLVLRVDETEQALVDLKVGQAVELGFGFRVARMHFVCPATVIRIEGALVTLTRPEEAKKQPRRGYARVSYRWPARITFHDGSVVNGVTCNVSASGALIDLGDFRFANCDLEEIHAVVLTAAHGREYQTAFRVMRCIRERGRTTIAIRYHRMPEVERVHLELNVLRGIARRFLRVSTELSCSAVLHAPNREISLQGLTENVSGGGALIRCQEVNDFEIGMRGDLVLQLEEGPLHLTDVIVNRVLEPATCASRIVLEFPHIKYECRIELVEFLKTKLGASRDV